MNLKLLICVDSYVVINGTKYTNASYFRFYTKCLGMKLLRKRDIPEEKYTNVFLGYGPEDSHFVIELTYSECLT